MGFFYAPMRLPRSPTVFQHLFFPIRPTHKNCFNSRVPYDHVQDRGLVPDVSIRVYAVSLKSNALPSCNGKSLAICINFNILAGFAAVMSVCTLFSTTLSAYLPKVKIFMQFVGAAYMLYLAWKVWRSSAGVEADDGKEASFLSGMILNPKIYIYAITAMTLYILPVYRSTGAVIGFTVLLALIGASGSFVWALFGSAICKFFSRHTKAVNLVMALLLVYCAVALFR